MHGISDLSSSSVCKCRLSNLKGWCMLQLVLLNLQLKAGIGLLFLIMLQMNINFLLCVIEESIEKTFENNLAVLFISHFWNVYFGGFWQLRYTHSPEHKTGVWDQAVFRKSTEVKLKLSIWWKSYLTDKELAGWPHPKS